MKELEYGIDHVGELCIELDSGKAISVLDAVMALLLANPQVLVKLDDIEDIRNRRAQLG